MAGPLLELHMGLRQKRRRARHEKPHMRGQRSREARIVQQARVERRHPHHRGRTRHQPDHLVHVQTGQKDHRAARQQRHIGRHEQAMRMKDRQGVQQHVLVGEPPRLGQHLCVGQQVAMGQHRPLGPARRARGIEKCRQIVRAPRDRCELIGLRIHQIGKAARPIGIDDHQRRAMRLRHRGQRLGAAAIRQQQLRRGIAHEIVDLGRRIGRVQRQKDRTRRHSPAIDRQRHGRLLDLHRNAVTGLDATGHQRIGHALDHRQKRGTADLGPVRQDQKGARAPGLRRKECIEKQVAHGSFRPFSFRSFAATASALTPRAAAMV